MGKLSMKLRESIGKPKDLWKALGCLIKFRLVKLVPGK